MRNTTKKQAVEKCFGGLSYGCKRFEHEISKIRPDIYCRKCDSRLGCAGCCEIDRDLICLKCHDWALDDGVKAHGPMIRDRQEALKYWQTVMRTMFERG